jgi:hypothetical protein
VATYDLLGDSIRFALVGIVWLADCQLCLDQTAAQQLLHCLVAHLLLKREKRVGRFRTW